MENKQTLQRMDNSRLAAVRSAGFGWSSQNWSGYAISGIGGAYSSISGEWVVPKVKPGKGNAYSSAWIGIDGYNNNSLIQCGTEHDSVNGKAIYYAWWEILPAIETRIINRISPGDRMLAEIRMLGPGKWRIQLSNRTRGWIFRTIRSYKGPQNSAEWIVEAPEVDGRISRLANFGWITMRRCRVNDHKPGLRKSDSGVIVQNNRTVSTPSTPNSNGDGFKVSYGPNSPIRPRNRTNSAPLLNPQVRLRVRG